MMSVAIIVVVMIIIMIMMVVMVMMFLLLLFLIANEDDGNDDKIKEKHKLQVSEDNVLRRITHPKRDKVSRQFRILHNEEFCNLLMEIMYWT
jgi:hypothetical protein